LICVILHFALAGIYGSDGSNGPYAKNTYAGAGFQGKHQADKIMNAKYAKNAMLAKKNAHRLKKNRASMFAANVRKANKHHAAAASNKRVAKKNAANAIAANKSRVKFHKNNSGKNVAFNKLKKKQNLLHNNLNAGNKLNKHALNKKMANIKKVNNFAKHNEFDDNYDVDAGMGSHGSSSGGAKHVTRRKHGQNHAFGNKMMKSNYGTLNAANLNKKTFLNQNKKARQTYVDAAKARMNNHHNNMGYAAAKNNYRKKNNFNQFAAVANRKKAVGNANAYKANKRSKKLSNLAAANKSARYKKKNSVGAAARNAHTYGNQYSRKKHIGNMN